MEKKLDNLGFEVTFNPPGDGNCFYSSAAHALGIETQSLEKVVFDYLKNHQFDVSIYSLLSNDKDKFVLSNGSDFYQNFQPVFEIHNNYKSLSRSFRQCNQLDIVDISKIPHVAYFGNYKLKLT